MKALKLIKDKLSKLGEVLFARTFDEVDDPIYILSVRVFQITTTGCIIYHKTFRELFCSAYDYRITTDEELIKSMLKSSSILTDEGVYINPKCIADIRIIKDITSFP